MRSKQVRMALLGIVVAVPCVFLAATHTVALRHRGLRPGETLPASTLQSVDGTTVSTEGWRGRPTLLVLFRSECQACRAEIQALSDIAPSLEGLRVALLSVDSGVRESDLPFPVYVDPGGALLRKTERLFVPVLYYIDPEARIVYARMGRRGKEEEMRTLQGLLIASSPTAR